MSAQEETVTQAITQDGDHLTVSGGTPASSLGRFSWAMFDFANQPYYTLITTFIFAPYFASGFIGDAVRGQELWGYTQSMAGLVIALGSPILGAIADQTGARKPWLAFFSLVFAAAISCLWFAMPGAPEGAFFIMGAVVVAAFSMEFAIVFNNAMLPAIVPEKKMGRLSGFGWGIGYVGGLIALFIVLLLMVANEETGKTLAGLAPILGLDPALHEADRFTGPMTGLWFLLFILPLLLFTPDVPRTRMKLSEAARKGLAQLGHTLSSLGRFRNIALFLISRMVYYDGLAAIFAFGGIYAAGTFGWKIETLAIFGIVLSIFAAIGAFVGGRLDDAIGSKRTIVLSVTGLVLSVLLAVSITRDEIFFVIAVPPVEPGGAPFSSLAEQVYLLSGILIGVFGGPAQAASRTLLARLAPASMMTEFFGLYSLSGKATSFIAPFAIAVATGIYESQRAGLAVIIGFLIIGLLGLLFVREERSAAL